MKMVKNDEQTDAANDLDLGEALETAQDFEEIGSEEVGRINLVTKLNQESLNSRRAAKQKISELREKKWFKRRNWFDDDGFFDVELEETA